MTLRAMKLKLKMELFFLTYGPNPAPAPGFDIFKKRTVKEYATDHM